MKRISMLLIGLIGTLMMVACGSDKGGGVTAIPVPGPGIIVPVDNSDPNRIVWVSDNQVSAQNKQALAEMITNLFGVCYISGYYAQGGYQYPFGNKNCENYTDAVDVGFTYHKETKKVELYVRAWCLGYECAGGLYTEYYKSSTQQNSSYSSLYANFGTTNTSTGAVPTDHSQYIVEIAVASGYSVDSETLPLTVYYGNGSLQRAVGTFQVNKL